MATITIENKHTFKGAGAYVGRPSVLGNPFEMEKDETKRKQVCDQYLVWLREQYRKGGAVRNELVRLAKLYKSGQDIVLICWCAPKQCHAEHIRDAIIGIASRM